MWTQEEQDKKDKERFDEIEKGGWLIVAGVFIIDYLSSLENVFGSFLQRFFKLFEKISLQIKEIEKTD